MNAMTTYAKPENDCLVIHVPSGYKSCSFKVLLFPIAEEPMPHGAEDFNLEEWHEANISDPAHLMSANEDLKRLAGTWVSDPAEETIFDEMRTVDSELWQ